MIVLAICFAMTVQTFIPQFAPITAYGAENPEAVRAVSAGSDEAGTGDISGETDASDVGDISGDESISETEVTENSFAPGETEVYEEETPSAPEETNVYEEENSQESYVPETEVDARIIE
ncbi:MAG: hypothetical protein K6E33_06830, partial [Lachnospiraceae bacterium]|nr:hypothetical protein [Lachnospiraceae bacterium]